MSTDCCANPVRIYDAMLLSHVTHNDTLFHSITQYGITQQYMDLSTVPYRIVPYIHSDALTPMNESIPIHTSTRVYVPPTVLRVISSQLEVTATMKWVEVSMY